MRIRSAIFSGVAALLSCGTGFSQTIVIDNFTSGTAPTGSNISLSQSGVGSNSITYSGLDASTVINPTGGSNQGIRIVRAHVTSGTNLLTIDNTGTNDQLNVGLGSATQGHFHLYYGYNNFNPALPANGQLAGDYADLNRNFTTGGNNAITLSVLNPDHNGGVEITLISGRGTGSEAIFTVAVPYVAGNPSTQQLNFFLSAFTGINTSDIDQIIVEPFGDIPAAGDLSLDNLQVGFAAVPEPATFALIGLTATAVGAGVWQRRRQQQKELLAR